MTRGYFTMTRRGGRLHYRDPQPEDIDIKDIAHSLSQLCRFTGHCEPFYSVAQHSVLVSEEVPREHKLAGLLHDAVEAYIGDIASPLKWELGPRVHELEDGIARVIFAKYGVPWPMHACIKRADLGLLATEGRDLMPNGLDLSGIPDMPPPISDLHIRPWVPEVARMVFLHQFEWLSNGQR
jgi:hypothetical protein